MLAGQLDTFLAQGDEYQFKEFLYREPDSVMFYGLLEHKRSLLALYFEYTSVFFQILILIFPIVYFGFK